MICAVWQGTLLCWPSTPPPMTPPLFCHSLLSPPLSLQALIILGVSWDYWSTQPRIWIKKRRFYSITIYLVLVYSVTSDESSLVRYPNWFNSMFEFCPKLIQFNIQFKVVSLKFSSKYHSIWINLLWFNRIDYSIQNNSMWFNSIDHSLQNKYGHF